MRIFNLWYVPRNDGYRRSNLFVDTVQQLWDCRGTLKDPTLHYDLCSVPRNDVPRRLSDRCLRHSNDPTMPRSKDPPIKRSYDPTIIPSNDHTIQRSNNLTITPSASFSTNSRLPFRLHDSRSCRNHSCRSHSFHSCRSLHSLGSPPHRSSRYKAF